MSKWIGVNDIKPPHKHEVIICLENGSVTTGWTIEGVWYYGGEPVKVIAWQELPDKPEICKLCGQIIRYIDPYWIHSKEDYRHPAIPK